MFTADAHADTLYALAVRGTAPEGCMVRPDRLRQGRVGLQTFALFAGHERDEGTPWERGQAMFSRAKDLGVPLLTGALPDAPPESPHGILSIEGGEMLEGKLGRLREFHRAGVRMIALTWNYENEIAYPVNGGSGRGLKGFGRELIAEMNRLGVMADVSHLNDAGIEEVLERSTLPVMATHSNLRELCDVPRNLPRALAREIIRKGGFIGVNFYAKFLAKDRPSALEDVLRHMDGLMELGGARAAGFGSDFDGIDEWPEGLGDPSRFPALLNLLAAHGYAQALLADIAGLNLWRALKTAERAGVPVL